MTYIKLSIKRTYWRPSVNLVQYFYHFKNVLMFCLSPDLLAQFSLWLFEWVPACYLADLLALCRFEALSDPASDVMWPRTHSAHSAMKLPL